MACIYVQIIQGPGGYVCHIHKRVKQRNLSIGRTMTCIDLTGREWTVLKRELLKWISQVHDETHGAKFDRNCKLNFKQYYLRMRHNGFFIQYRTILGRQRSIKVEDCQISPRKNLFNIFKCLNVSKSNFFDGGITKCRDTLIFL